MLSGTGKGRPDISQRKSWTFPKWARHREVSMRLTSGELLTESSNRHLECRSVLLLGQSFVRESSAEGFVHRVLQREQETAR